MSRLAAACLAVLFAGAAFAQGNPADRERLIDLYQVTISQDLCNFPLTDKQADLVVAETDLLETRLSMGEDESQRLYDQLEAQMTTQKAAGLCNADGAWARAYTKILERLGT